MSTKINNIEIKVSKSQKGGERKVLGHELRSDPFAIFSIAVKLSSSKPY